MFALKDGRMLGTDAPILVKRGREFNERAFAPLLRLGMELEKRAWQSSGFYHHLGQGCRKFHHRRSPTSRDFAHDETTSSKEIAYSVILSPSQLVTVLRLIPWIYHTSA